ncbi:hypothetical protein SAMN04489806_0843 [Paramicrobacterium humi]|uniref:DUF4333 domain-containing protein n=1 Tax=Paramicrobacterium humi TaxID=640635 RepID=A0A1H4JUE9_9MICO|nr:hypothetical protein [Microbacterium humi]SEB49262.1 hypothetical protein SAMN04489806_0843 [Microbacterium humi]
MPGRTRTALAAMMGAFAVALLAGCQSSEGPFASGATAELPAGFSSDEFDSSSVRLLGADSEGYEYFAAKKKDSSGEDSCVMIVPPGEEGAAVCSGRLPVAGISHDVRVMLSDVPVKENSESETIGDFLQVARTD